jgi:hypothetical protein
MRTLGLIRRASPAPTPDLWSRLRARLHADDALTLRMPAIGWLEGAAAAVVVGTLVAVPDRLRFLTACGLL